MNHKAILRIHCPDQKGLVARITRFIFEKGGNITYLDQYTDPEENAFFFRVEWELADFSIEKDQIAAAIQKDLAGPFQMSFSLNFSDEVPRLAVFVSKESHCLFDILARVESGEFRVEIPLIISNHPDLSTIAERFSIPYHHLPINAENHTEQEEKTLELLKDHRIDLIILARYMRILTGKLIEPYRNRIINIHHSMLPAFAGGKPYHAALARGVKIIGATSHYVTEELDQGPIIEQETVHVRYNEKLDDLVRKGKDLEKIVLSRAIWHHLEHKVMAYKNRTVIFKG